MKPFYFVVMDGVFDLSMQWIVSYEMQKASSSWVNPDAMSLFFGDNANIYHYTHGALEVDGGLNECGSVKQIVSLGDIQATENTVLLLDSGLTFEPRDFQGLMDKTNDWFWRLLLTHKAVFRWVCDSCMPDWNPVYEYYTKGELLAIIGNDDSYKLFCQKFSWQNSSDTLFIKSPMASRGEGNIEVPYNDDKLMLRGVVEKFTSDYCLVEQAKGFFLGDNIQQDYRYQTSRVGIFYQPDAGVKVVEMCSNQHVGYDSHHKKRQRREDVTTVDDTGKFLAFFENMNQRNTLDKINNLLQKDMLTDGKKDLCRVVLHAYLDHFYKIYQRDLDITDSSNKEELNSLLNFFETYSTQTNHSIIALSCGEHSPKYAYARSMIAKFAILAFSMKNESAMSFLLSHYGDINTIQAIINDLMPNTLHFQLEWLCPSEPYAVITEMSSDDFGYHTP